MVDITPRELQRAVKLGFKRMKRFRKARAMFIKQYVGQYYRENYGLTNDEPINLIFNAISVFVPNMVMRHGITEVTTNIVPYKQYAELLGLALDNLHNEIDLKQILRKWLIDSFFGLSVLKTGICASNSYFNIEDILVDPGQIYTAHVDLDDFVIDAACNDLNESSFYGNRVKIPRQMLLDDPEVNSDIALKLPSASSTSSIDDKDRAEQLSQKSNDVNYMYELNDMVNVIEIWVPDADAIALIADPHEFSCDEFLKIQDYYGPESGQYTFLIPTPTVPGNPFPIAPVGIWYDLHVMANQLFKKLLQQAERQKDVLGYDPAHADEAQDILEASDGDAVAMTDPTKTQIFSFGGQNDKNAAITSQLQVWFDYIAGSPDRIAGLQDAKTATQADINQANSSIRLSDMRQILYDAAGKLSSKEAFYLHNDPLIEIPLTKRVPGSGDAQIVLTPEQVEGDWLDYNFKLKAKSLSQLDPTVRAKRIVEFSVKIMPGLVQSARTCMAIGVPFNIKKAVLQLAEEMEILDEVLDWFEDPEYIEKLKLMMQLGPQSQGKGDIKGVIQNEGLPNAASVQNLEQEKNAIRQERAGMAQVNLPNKIGG